MLNHHHPLTGIFKILSSSLCAISLLGCGGQRHAQPSDERFSLTVYSTANPATFDPQEMLRRQSNGYAPTAMLMPGFGVVREIRTMQLSAGLNNLEFTDVAAGIDPTTVAIQSLTAPQNTSVLEQNFEYDLANSEMILRKYIGKELTLTIREPKVDNAKSDSADETRDIRGTLLSMTGYYMIRPTDPPQEIRLLTDDQIVSWHLPDKAEDLVIKPTLKWKLQARKAGTHQMQVAYQTEGLTWRADYSLVLAPDEKTADLSAWVTLMNASGLSYPDAKLKLVAGNVQRLMSDDRARQYGMLEEQGQGQYYGNVGNGNAIDQKRFFDYHAYTLDQRTSLENNSTKQVELFTTRRQIPVQKVYVFDSLTRAQRSAYYLNPAGLNSDFGRLGNNTVDIYLQAVNSEANNLGIPLPAGRMRTYASDPADDMREFVGEDVITHTPRNEEILTRIGTAFDITAERIQTSYKSKVFYDNEETFEITLRNYQTAPVQILARELLYRGVNWEITDSSDKWVKQDYHTIRFPVTVPANGQKKITYKVHYFQ